VLIKTIGASVYIKVSTITDPVTLDYVWRVGRVRPRGWMRLRQREWRRRPGVRKPELKAKE